MFSVITINSYTNAIEFIERFTTKNEAIAAKRKFVKNSRNSLKCSIKAGCWTTEAVYTLNADTAAQYNRIEQAIVVTVHDFRQNNWVEVSAPTLTFSLVPLGTLVKTFKAVKAAA